MFVLQNPAGFIDYPEHFSPPDSDMWLLRYRALKSRCSQAKGDGASGGRGVSVG